MHCSNCGKEIPYTGKVCPYCNTEKSGDKTVSAALWVGGIPGGIIGGFVGHTAEGPIFGFMAGFVSILVINAFLFNKKK